MLNAVVAHAPKFGATVGTFDSSAARDIAGVREIVEIPTGVAIIADTFWAATKARDALVINWDFAAAEQRGTAELKTEFKRHFSQPGVEVRRDGDVDTAFANASKIVEAVFEFPYLAHAAMEPLNAVVEITPRGCEIWTGSQSPTNDQNVAAAILGIEPHVVKIHTQFAGRSFGRRAPIDSDYVAEAVSIAKAMKRRAPVKLQWTREDDMRSDSYRPMSIHSMRAAINAKGEITGWSHRIVAHSILKGTRMDHRVSDGIDATIVEGARNLPYGVANFACDLHLVDVAIPTLWWRSVGHSHNGYATEVFFDEVAVAAGHDPVELRQQLLSNHPRHEAVLKLALEKAGPAQSGDRRGRGVAIHESFRSVVAQVVDITLQDDGRYSVDDVVCAVDCGIAVNPDIVRAQMEGGIGFGLGATMREAIEIDAGMVTAKNFDRYQTLRVSEMPRVAVHIVPSINPPTGVGEPGVPPIGPALANALRAATGTAIHRLPIGRLISA